MVQCNTRCILSSLSDLHKMQVDETECWLNFALFACNVYVPVMSLALMFGFVSDCTVVVNPTIPYEHDYNAPFLSPRFLCRLTAFIKLL